MREIIHLQIGKFGNQLGKEFWRAVLKEHRLKQSGIRLDRCKEPIPNLQYSDVLFMEREGTRGNKYIPRAILVELSPWYLENLRSDLFDHENIIYNDKSTGNIWTKGYYDGMSILESVLDCMQKQAEACDSLQGIHIMHSLSGGTGSGMGSLLLEYIRQEYPRIILQSYTAMALSDPYNIAVAPLNAGLSMKYLMEYVDQVICMDMNCVYPRKILKTRYEKAIYGDLSPYIAPCMSGITACLRFPGELNTNPQKIKINLESFPQQHFYIPSYVPQEKNISKRLSVLELKQLFNIKNMFVKCNLAKEKILSAATIFRGKISPVEMDNEMLNIQEHTRDLSFVKWIQNPVHTATCHEEICDCETCAIALLNTTAICQPLGALFQSFKMMFKKRLYLHHYYDACLSETDFVEAQNKFSDLISTYMKVPKMENN